MTAPLYIFEGAWDSPLEAPLVLPYLMAYAGSHREIKVYHRTIRNAADIAYYVSKIPKGNRSFLYIACHGEPGLLDPSDGRSKITLQAVVDSLSKAKEDSVSFLHFGCCEFIKADDRIDERIELLKSLSGATESVWTSGYTKDIDYLSSTLLDLALISEVYVPWRKNPRQKANAQKAALSFYSAYSQLASSLGFVALSSLREKNSLFPPETPG